MRQIQKHYLVIGPSWIGDMVMAQSLFITLKQLYPDCLIDVVAPEWSFPILKRMPEVDVAMSADVEHGEFSFFKRRRFGAGLRQRNYTDAIIIPRSWKSAIIPFFAGIPIRTGYRGEMRYGLLNDIRVLDKKVLKQTVQRYVALAYPNHQDKAPETPFPRLQVDQMKQDGLLQQFGLKLDKPVVCIMPGAEYGLAKQWPIAYYADLAQSLIAKGWQVWILGSAKDKNIADTITGERDGIYNLCGKTLLQDTVDLLACAESVVSNDSGLMHVAAAVGVKVNVIYGSSTPEYTPPLASEEKMNVFYLKLDCSPCFQRECRFGHYDCLNGILPNTVLTGVISDTVVKKGQ